MAIAKAPKRTSAPSTVDEQERERRADAFISGAGKAAGELPTPVDAKKKPSPIRFDPDIYPRMDAAAKRRGLSRAAWVRLVVSHALEAEEPR